MKTYLIIERFYPEKIMALYERLERSGRMLPDGVVYIDSWIDDDVRTCFQIMESDAPEKIMIWIGQWKDLAQFEVMPVMKSSEARARALQMEAQRSDSASIEISIEHRIPTVAEYQKLRGATGWASLDDRLVEKALPRSLFAVCAAHEDQTIGTGRIIGDGAMYFYIQDVIVLPAYRGYGVGRMIMDALESWLNDNAEKNAFIGLMAAEGVKDFYRKFHYIERKFNAPGMYRIAKSNHDR